MNPHIEFDNSVLRKRIVALNGALKKEPPEIIRRVARQWVEMCIRLTPPVGKNPFSETPGAALEVGREAIKRDIERVFVPAEILEMIGPQASPASDVGKAFWRAARRGRMDEANKILKANGLEYAAVTRTVDPAFHKRQRRRVNGRVMRTPQRHLVTNAGRIQTYIREVQKKIGFARSGWKEAAINLKVRPRHFPAWASRHSGRGKYQGRLSGFHPFIIFGNLVGYIQRAGRSLNIMRKSHRKILKNLEQELVVLGTRSKNAWKRAA